MGKRSVSRAFDGYVRRLQQSSNATERDSTYWGYTLNHQIPVLIPTELLFEHVHILGGTGTGKTALGLLPLLKQLIRRNDGPVMVLDLKGDPAMFNTARIEADAANRKFKWFTNKTEKSTYVFNPWQQSHLEHLAIQEILGLFLLSLNLHHGDDYGRSFFSLASRTLLQDCIHRCLKIQQTTQSKYERTQQLSGQPPMSFVDLEEKLRALANSSEEYRAGQHLLNVLKSLLDFPQLNLALTKDHTPTQLKHAIHMPTVVAEKQVVYFFLQAAMDPTTIAEIARLALYSMLAAAITYREQTGKKPKVYVIADEAQHLIALNIANVLAQARQFGMACILAHQSMSQLNPPGGVDLRDLVLECTSVKQFWSARSPSLKDHISKISGEVGYSSASWLQDAEDAINRDIGRELAAAKSDDEEAFVQIAESPGPRLTSQDIEDYSLRQNTSILSVERHVGFCCFQGAFPVHMDWTLSKDVYEHRANRIPWPEVTEETLVTHSMWPKMAANVVQPPDINARTTADDDAEFHEGTEPPQDTKKVTDKLDELGRRFNRKRRGNR